MPRVSFVIPTWDGDSYLAETLESLMKQTMSDIEIVVVDDASPDFTYELMKWYEKKDNRIKYHRLEENKGVVHARNYGNQVAQGEIICVNDHDDLSMPNRAEFSYTYLIEHPEVDCITSAYHETDVDGVPGYKWTPNNVTLETLLDGTYLDSGGWMHSSAAYRRKDILELPYRKDDSCTDDYAFLMDWLKAGKKFVSVPEVLANCRRLPWGQMARMRQRQGMGANYHL